MLLQDEILKLCYTLHGKQEGVHHPGAVGDVETHRVLTAGAGDTLSESTPLNPEKLQNSMVTYKVRIIRLQATVSVP